MGNRLTAPAQLETRAVHPRAREQGLVHGFGRQPVTTASTPIPDDARLAMEPLFGVSLARMRIFPESPLARARGAQALSVGGDIHVAPGRWAPSTSQGRGLLAHEVAHALQQGRGAGASSFRADYDRAHLEAEADRAEAAFQHGRPFEVLGRAPASLELRRDDTTLRPQQGVEGSYLDNGQWDEEGTSYSYVDAAGNSWLWFNDEWHLLGPPETIVVHETTPDVSYRVAEARATLVEARRLASSKDPADRESAAWNLMKVYNWSRKLVTTDNISRHIHDGIGISHAQYIAGGASDAVISMRRKLLLGQMNDAMWNYEMRVFDMGAELLEVLGDERKAADSPVATTLGKSTKYLLLSGGAIVAVAGVIILVGAAAPAIAAEAALIAFAASNAGTAVLCFALTEPIAATAIAEFGLGVVITIGSSGGIRQYLQNLNTPEGKVQLVLQVVVLGAQGGGGGGSGGNRGQTIDIEGEGTIDPGTGNTQFRVTRVPDLSEETPAAAPAPIARAPAQAAPAPKVPAAPTVEPEAPAPQAPAPAPQAPSPPRATGLPALAQRFWFLKQLSLGAGRVPPLRGTSGGSAPIEVVDRPLIAAPTPPTAAPTPPAAKPPPVIEPTAPTEAPTHATAAAQAPKAPPPEPIVPAQAPAPAPPPAPAVAAPAPAPPVAPAPAPPLAPAPVVVSQSPSRPTEQAVATAEGQATTTAVQAKYGHLGVRDISTSKSTNATGPDRLFVIGHGDDILLVEVDAKLSIQEEPVVISSVSSFDTQAKNGGQGRLALVDGALKDGKITPAEHATLVDAVAHGAVEEMVVGVGSVKGISDGLKARGVTFVSIDQFAHIQEQAAAQQARQSSIDVGRNVGKVPASRTRKTTHIKQLWELFNKEFLDKPDKP